jgi:uncharacterized protein (TIGR00255 family)
MTVRSMTGYGRATAETPEWSLQVVVKSVNHRGLDVALRSRLDLAEHEAAVRERVNQGFTRGRVEVTIEGKPTDGEAALGRVDADRLRAAAADAQRWFVEKLLPTPATAGDLLRWPGVVESQPPKPFADDAVARAALLDALAAAVAQAQEGRAREGAALDSILRDKIAGLHAVGARLRERRDAAREEIRRQFEARIQELLGQVPADPHRVAQEVAFLIERGDVQEELDRLAAHLDHFVELMTTPAPGKRLDFLTQEILRELNTTGSKAKDVALIRAVLDGKTLCEQLREQVQNVE